MHFLIASGFLNSSMMTSWTWWPVSPVRSYQSMQNKRWNCSICNCWLSTYFPGKDGPAECLSGIFPPRPSLSDGQRLCLHSHTHLHEGSLCQVLQLHCPFCVLNCSSLLMETCFFNKEMFPFPRIHGEGEANEQAALWGLQIDFLRIVSSHEHFIPLNLPQVISNPCPMMF